LKTILGTLLMRPDLQFAGGGYRHSAEAGTGYRVAGWQFDGLLEFSKSGE